MEERKFILMCAEEKIAELTKGNWIIYNKDLMPKGLDIRKQANFLLPGLEESVEPGWVSWLSQRIVAIDRKNIKKVMNILNLSQDQDEYTKAKISLTFRAVSLLDSYWLRFSDEDIVQWKDVNLRQNSLSKALAMIALAGNSFTLQVKKFEKTAEVFTHGLYPKGWFREDDKLWLYKANDAENEVEREICASQIIDCFNVYGNLKYEAAEKFGVKCSRCELMANEQKFIVSAAEMDIWCGVNGMTVNEYTERHYPKEYAQMIVIDYLTANPDRHKRNWGFYQDSKTGKILDLHELYDHNKAFDEMYMTNNTLPSVMDMNYTQEELALKHIKQSGLKLLQKPTKEIFPNELAYETFVIRCKQLNLWGSSFTLNKFN